VILLLTFEKNEILSTTDVIKNFSDCRKITKEKSRTIIFKNNKPDLVMLDIQEYENMCNLISLLEDLDIQAVLKERLKDDTGKRYSLDEIGSMYNLK
jgi:PHD/YefM family antitoxin component YafN of YafNO toxin-antitoxin module